VLTPTSTVPLSHFTASANAVNISDCTVEQFRRLVGKSLPLPAPRTHEKANAVQRQARDAEDGSAPAMTLHSESRENGAWAATCHQPATNIEKDSHGA